MSLFWMLGMAQALGQAADHGSSVHVTGSVQPAIDRAEKRIGDRLDRLALVCAAMWSILQEQADLTEEDLLARVREIDLRDGQADGKISPQIVRCRQCDRVMSPRHQRCLYCGAEKLEQTAFDGAT